MIGYLVHECLVNDVELIDNMKYEESARDVQLLEVSWRVHDNTYDIGNSNPFLVWIKLYILGIYNF